MGCRATIAVETAPRKYVFLYTHWRGEKAPELVQKALRRNQRWDDAPYLTRILFCELCNDYEGETGFGISADPVCPDYPCIVIRPATQEMCICNNPARLSKKYAKSTWSFREICETPTLCWSFLDPESVSCAV